LVCQIDILKTIVKSNSNHGVYTRYLDILLRTVFLYRLYAIPILPHNATQKVLRLLKYSIRKRKTVQIYRILVTYYYNIILLDCTRENGRLPRPSVRLAPTATDRPCTRARETCANVVRTIALHSNTRLRCTIVAYIR